jgi:hypothetical protein
VTQEIREQQPRLDRTLVALAVDREGDRQHGTRSLSHLT